MQQKLLPPQQQQQQQHKEQKEDQRLLQHRSTSSSSSPLSSWAHRRSLSSCHSRWGWVGLHGYRVVGMVPAHKPAGKVTRV
jgi:hypothetical protein